MATKKTKQALLEEIDGLTKTVSQMAKKLADKEEEHNRLQKQFALASTEYLELVEAVRHLVVIFYRAKRFG